MAASRLQISADFIHVACNFRPCGYNLHATGGQSGQIYMRLAASSMQIVPTWPVALAAICVQSRQFFASALREQLFELKNEDAI